MRPALRPRLTYNGDFPENSRRRLLMKNTLAPLLVTITIQVMTALSMLTVPVLAPTAAPDIGVSVTYVGLFVGIVYLGAMLSSLVGGTLVLRFGAIRVSQACLLICAAGLATAMLATPPALVAAAVLIGCGYGPITPASSHILAKSTPRHLMGLVFSIKQTGVPLGGALAGVLIPPLVLATDWRTALAATSATCLAMAALAQPVRFALDDDRMAGQRLGLLSIIAPLKLVLSTASIRALAFSSMFYAAMQMCLMGYLVTYLVSDLGLTMVQAGVTLAVAQGGGIVGRILWGAVADRWVAPRRMFGLLGLMMSAGATSAALFSPAWPTALLLAACALFGASAIGWNGVQLAQVAQLAPPGKAGQATGGTLFISYFGVVAGPPLFGAIVGSGFGYPAAFLVMALPPLVIGLRFAVGRAEARPTATG